jgi:hypothetical protein
MTDDSAQSRNNIPPPSTIGFESNTIKRNLDAQKAHQFNLHENVKHWKRHLSMILPWSGRKKWNLQMGLEWKWMSFLYSFMKRKRHINIPMLK